MKLKTLFLDTNVVLELLFKRQQVPILLPKLEQYNQVYISFLTVHLIYHFGKKIQLEDWELNFILSRFKILNQGSNTYETAKQICKDQDFEDALQLACAIEGNIKDVITLDEKMKKLYSAYFNFI
jgi:predicted nucleic acid-binding protein